MQIAFSQPKGFDPSVYVVRITLEADELTVTCGERFYFELPQYKEWLFRVYNSGDRFRRPAGAGEHGDFVGVFCDGSWEMIVQSNGVEENKNPVLRSTLERKLHDSVSRRLSEIQGAS